MMKESRWFRRGATSAATLGALLWFAWSAPAQAQTEAEIAKRVVAIVAEWEQHDVFDDAEIYAGQIKELTRLGQAAVPALTKALDATSHDPVLRFLPFALRAIGDPRAVPALIRAIPRTLRPGGSDCGVNLENRELLAFMQTYDLGAMEARNGQRRDFDVGRPIREVAGALRKITGARLNEEGVFHTFLVGGEEQRAVQRRAFQQVAETWRAWWLEHWKEFGSDPVLAEVSLPAGDEGALNQRFSSGEDIKASGGYSGVVVGPVADGKNCALVLALNRNLDLPEGLAENGRDARISVWAARSGVDLLGTRFHDPDSGKDFYAVRGAGLQAWEVDGSIWQDIKEATRVPELPPLNAPAGDLLVSYDAAAGRYRPEKRATFLFITRDGLRGILRVMAQVTKPMPASAIGMPYLGMPELGPDQPEETGFAMGVKLEYKFFYEQTEAMLREEIARTEQRAARQEARKRRRIDGLFAKHPKLEGTVYLPAGGPAHGADTLLGSAILSEREPATGATVLLGSAMLGDREFVHADLAPLARTGADGTFVLPHVPTEPKLYVVHPSGFAELNAEGVQSPITVQLASWGRIEGIKTRAGKPAAGERMAIRRFDPQPGESGRLSLSPAVFKAETDAQGRFVLTNIPPGEVQVYRMVGNTYYEGYTAQIKAGETTRLQHGFNGRTLRGRLASSSPTKADWQTRGFRFSTKREAPEPPPDEDPELWVRRYWQTPEGSKIAQRAIHFPVLVQPNGEFTIQDVPPGTYEISGSLREGGGENLWALGRVIGRLKEEVVVPEVTGAEDQPIQIGEFVVQMVTVLKHGDLAPDFEIEAIDGAPMRLRDFQGKHLLLDFWATWCGPCLAEMPTLKRIYESFGSNPDYAMIGLSLDLKVEPLIDYAKKEELPWRNAFLDKETKAALLSRYGVEGIPRTFLIGPDGRIIEAGLRGEEMFEAVRKALNAR